MKITEIEKAGGDRYTVYVDGEYWWILDLEIILQNSLKPGKEVGEQELEHLRYQAQRRTAREPARKNRMRTVRRARQQDRARRTMRSRQGSRNRREPEL